MAVIEVRGLSKSFKGVPAVRGISLTVEEGDIFGFLGPNGSGKTTTIRMICGLLSADAGEGTCLGYDVRRQQGLIKRHVGYMTQRFSLYEDLTVSENLDFIARMYQLPDRDRVVADAVERLGLGDRRAQLAGGLSGGWKQRLALAASLLHEPKLLLLDEPTAGVDPAARREFWDTIQSLAGEGVTTLVSTHYMDEAERCNKLAYIAYGAIRAQGSADEVIAASGLSTWVVTADAPWRLSRRIQAMPGAQQVAVFGTTLHVSGRDGETLAASMAALAAEGVRAQRGAPGLEDVFIDLMKGAKG